MPMWAQVETEQIALMRDLLSDDSTPNEILRRIQTRIDGIVREYQRMAAKRHGVTSAWGSSNGAVR
jgi:hypothetical protein